MLHLLLFFFILKLQLIQYNFYSSFVPAMSKSNGSFCSDIRNNKAYLVIKLFAIRQAACPNLGSGVRQVFFFQACGQTCHARLNIISNYFFCISLQSISSFSVEIFRKIDERFPECRLFNVFLMNRQLVQNGKLKF